MTLHLIVRLTPETACMESRQWRRLTKSTSIKLISNILDKELPHLSDLAVFTTMSHRLTTNVASARDPPKASEAFDESSYDHASHRWDRRPDLVRKTWPNSNGSREFKKRTCRNSVKRESLNAILWRYRQCCVTAWLNATVQRLGYTTTNTLKLQNCRLTKLTVWQICCYAYLYASFCYWSREPTTNEVVPSIYFALWAPKKCELCD